MFRISLTQVTVKGLPTSTVVPFALVSLGYQVAAEADDAKAVKAETSRVMETMLLDQEQKKRTA